MRASPAAWALAALAVAGFFVRAMDDDPSPFARRDGFRLWGAATHRVALRAEMDPLDAWTDAEIVLHSATDFTVRGAFGACAVALGSGEAVVVDGRRCVARVVLDDGRVSVFLDGATARFVSFDALSVVEEDTSLTGVVTAPLPGVVAALEAPSGSRVAAGQVVLALEAMKMEHTVRAPVAGVVVGLDLAVGDRVEAGTILFRVA